MYTNILIALSEKFQQHQCIVDFNTNEIHATEDCNSVGKKNTENNQRRHRKSMF